MSALAHSQLINELESVIVHGTPDGRAGIFERVTDLFLTSPIELAGDQAKLFDDIVQKLIPRWNLWFPVPCQKHPNAECSYALAHMST